MLKRLGSMRLAGLAGSASALMVLVHYGASTDMAQLLVVPRPVWLYAALMALFSTVLPIYWMALAIQRMGPTHTAAVGNLGPVLTILASWALLNEAISSINWQGWRWSWWGCRSSSLQRPVRPMLWTAGCRRQDQRRAAADFV